MAPALYPLLTFVESPRWPEWSHPVDSRTAIRTLVLPNGQWSAAYILEFLMDAPTVK